MYAGTLGAVSNMEDWVASFTAIDDTGAPFSFTGAAMVVFVCDPDIPKNPILSGSVADGTIVISADGFTWTWTFLGSTEMSLLTANQYAVYARMTLGGTTVQIIAGAGISIVEGGPTG
jgi:hypothetical protein